MNVLMKQAEKILLVVGGPTGSGKTALAIALARHFETDIISADSRQFYKEMKIGNARPSAAELSLAKHHFVADRSLQEPLSAGTFAREAMRVLKDIFLKKDYAVLVGGSGLFIRALTKGLDDFPAVEQETRDRVDKLYEEQGLEGLQNKIAAVDPAYFEEVDQQNPARLKRALEVYFQSGKPYSVFRSKAAANRPFLPIYLQPYWPRAVLYDRINQRVDMMMQEGLSEEARSLAKYKDLPAMQTVGYQEWWPFFEGQVQEDTVTALIKQNSRRYAKRQLTWNRRDGFWKLVPKGDLLVALAYIRLLMHERLCLQSLPAQDGAFLLSKKEQRLKLGLVSMITNKTEHTASVVVLDDWAYLTIQVAADASHLLKASLLYEACYRADCVLVYAEAGMIDTSLLKSLGWKPAKTEELPEKLSLKWPEKQMWKWTREEQPVMADQ